MGRGLEAFHTNVWTPASKVLMKCSHLETWHENNQTGKNITHIDVGLCIDETKWSLGDALFRRFLVVLLLVAPIVHLFASIFSLAFNKYYRGSCRCVDSGVRDWLEINED